MIENRVLKLLVWALENAPETLYAVDANVILSDSARVKPERPAYLTLNVPDELVQSLRGDKQRRDTVLLIRIPADVRQRAESPIIRPGDLRRG